MFSMPIVDLLERGRKLAETGMRVSVLWQSPDSLCFVARGREYRSEFHINPGDETMYMIKGEMRLHSRTPEGKEQIDLIPQGSYHLHAGRHAPFAALSARRFRADFRAQTARRRS